MPIWLARHGPLILVLAATLLLVWLAYGWAYGRGYDARDAELRAETEAMQTRLHQLADTLSERAAELQAARAARDDLERMLKDEAARDPMAGDPGLGADSLHRLDRIR